MHRYFNDLVKNKVNDLETLKCSYLLYINRNQQKGVVDNRSGTWTHNQVDEEVRTRQTSRTERRRQIRRTSGRS